MTTEAIGNSARVVAVLDALVRAGRSDVGVRELAADLDMSRSAAHRILATLSDAGYARALASGRYRMTGLLTAWGVRLEHGHRVLTAARPVMAALAATTSENVHLYLRLPETSTGAYVATAAGSHAISYQVELGRPTPLHVAAAGRACLAALPEAEGRELMNNLPEAQRVELQDAVLRIQERGFATSVGQLLPEASGVAAAITRNDVVIGSLTMSMPVYRLAAAMEAGHAERVMRSAAEVSTELSDQEAIRR